MGTSFKVLLAKSWRAWSSSSGLLQARTLNERWRREYNEERPKKALGGMTPAAYAKHLTEIG